MVDVVFPKFILQILGDCFPVPIESQYNSMVEISSLGGMNEAVKILS